MKQIEKYIYKETKKKEIQISYKNTVKETRNTLIIINEED
jgi:hypothetical protein